ncbi:MAG: hypothetical protein WBQ21_09330 [Solirubrobacteraceae bacterium]
MALTTSGETVLEQLRRLPGGRELLDVAQEHNGAVELVGGAVRDIMLGSSPRELDVVVDGDAHSFATALAQRLDTLAGANPGGHCEVVHHERFRTALVSWEGGEIDVATRRSETYPAPGALPDIVPGTAEQDLARRDFTVNALAVALAGEHRGELRAVSGALEDLAARRLRVLHDASFRDDPTRMLRLARYRARLGFTVEDNTLRLVREAVDARALDTVSGARVGAELRLALAEDGALSALGAMDELGLLSALHPRLSLKETLASAALELLSAGARRGRHERYVPTCAKPARVGLLLLAAILHPMLLGLEDGAEAAAYTLLNDLEFPAADRDLALHAAICADAVADELSYADNPSEVYDALCHVSPEGIALAGAWATLEWGPLSQAAIMAHDWFSHISHVDSRITGDDLIAAGVPEGPEIGWRLKAAHMMLLDGLVPAGHESELRAALEAEV